MKEPLIQDDSDVWNQSQNLLTEVPLVEYISPVRLCQLTRTARKRPTSTSPGMPDPGL